MSNTFKSYYFVLYNIKNILKNISICTLKTKRNNRSRESLNLISFFVGRETNEVKRV